MVIRPVSTRLIKTKFSSFTLLPTPSTTGSLELISFSATESLITKGMFRLERKRELLFLSVNTMIALTNRFHVAVRLFSNRSQMTSKCGKNKKVAHEAQPSVSLMFLPHFDVLCDLLLNRRTATWNLFVLYNKKIKIHGKNALLFQISPL